MVGELVGSDNFAMDIILQERASGHPQMSVGRVVADGGVGGVLTIGVDLYTFGSARAQSQS